MKRLWLCIGASLVVALASGTPASAGQSGPMITPSQATFTVAKDSAGTTWTLNLWAHGKLVSTTSGTAGTLAVAVPATPACKFQADVLRGGKWFAGTFTTLATCGGHSATTTTTTTTTTSTTTTTLTPSVTSSKGGHKPKDGKPKAIEASAPSPTTIPPTIAAAKATKSPTKVSASRLAFTGTGVGLWILGLAGSGLLLLGALLLVRRPRLRLRR
ncbi:MAG TPA: hypothetical protein VN816_01565 [Acidimicrobiales bacterium]|nr:hypothetical protein [Acidimicrobiales bacterium]